MWIFPGCWLFLCLPAPKNFTWTWGFVPDGWSYNKVPAMNAHPIIQAMNLIPLFQGLESSVLESLAREARIIEKSRYQYIYVPGDASTELFFVLEGSVKLGVYQRDYKEQIRDILHPNAYFGELSLAGIPEREGFAMTMGDKNRLLVIPSESLLREMSGNRRLQQIVLHALADRLRNAEHRADDLIHKDARTRIVDYLKDTVEKRGRRIGFEMYLKHGLTQQDIASITGTSRQTVTQVLNELKKANCIHFTRRSILIRDMTRLGAQV